jgi:hypothetical protein
MPVADLTAANAEAFAQPHWRVIARGHDVERWFDDGQAMDTGGILLPQPTRLPAGQYYYRFASSTSSRSTRVSGGWWIDFEIFHRIERFAADHGHRLRDAARLLLALPCAWTRVDLVLRAMLLRPLRARTDVGKPAQGAKGGADRGTRCIPPPRDPVRQQYIPGLFVRRAGESLAGWDAKRDQPQLHATAFARPVQAAELRR